MNPEADLPLPGEMTPRVSVIVPVFNTAPYLPRCLQSLRESTLREIEIICVDDASTDESAAIVEGFARQDSRIRLIRHERNLGLGGARNTGIAAARAEYVGGLDSDDWVGPTMFERLFDGTDGGRADVVEGGLIQIDSTGEVLWTYKPTPRVVENTQDQINIFEATRQAFYTKIWRRALFTDHDIWFPERLYYEDLATTPRLLAKAKRIRFIEDASYFYVKRDGSLTFSASDKHQMDYFRVFDILWDFLLKNNLADRYRNEFVQQVSGHLTYHAGNVLNLDLPGTDKAQYLRHLLVMGSAYRESHADLHGVSSEDLAGRFKEGSTIERVPEIARLRRDAAALEAKAAALGKNVLSLERTLKAERKRHLDLVSDPLWKLTAPLRKLTWSARQVSGKLGRGET